MSATTSAPRDPASSQQTLSGGKGQSYQSCHCQIIFQTCLSSARPLSGHATTIVDTVTMSNVEPKKEIVENNASTRKMLIKSIYLARPAPEVIDLCTPPPVTIDLCSPETPPRTASTSPSLPLSTE